MTNQEHAKLSTYAGLGFVLATPPPKPAPGGMSPAKEMTHCQRVIATRRDKQANQFPPLALEKRPLVTTEQAAHYLNRRPQTLRAWASAETFPDGLRPIRVNGRLGWPVDGIRRVLGVSA